MVSNLNQSPPKIALIIPRFSKGFRLESVPLNLSYLGAVLEQKGYLVKGFNLNFDKVSFKEFRSFDIFGLSSTTVLFSQVVKLAKKIKVINKKAVIVVGGPHPTACSDECLGIKEIDFVIVGEGEKAFPLLIEAIEKGIGKTNIPNLVFRQGKKIIHNKIEKILDLDEIPFPAKHLFNTLKYPDKQKAYGDIIASRGCPFLCTNCKPGLDNIAPYRLRRSEKVVDEMEWLKKKFGVKHFTFSDSELAGPKDWVKGFTSEILKRKLRITYVCNGRVDQIDEEILCRLKKSGCVFIGYGVESGSQEVIDNLLKKGINLKEAKRIIGETIKHGIGVGAWFMIGIPGETKKQIMETIKFARSLDAFVIEINIAMPWPDTGFYYLCKKKNWIKSDDWSLYDEKKGAVIETDFLSRKEVNKCFNLFKNVLSEDGWRTDESKTRFYHPDFAWRNLKLNLMSVVRRGLGKEDFIKLIKWLKWQKR